MYCTIDVYSPETIIMWWLNILVEISHNYYDLERKDSKLSTEIWHGMQYMFLKRTCRRKHKFYRYVSSKISGNEYGRLKIETCRRHYITYALFVFQYRSFTVCLPTVGPELALSCRHILPLNIDISGKTWVWGSFPFPRASKLEMWCSSTLVKLLLIWHKLAKLATFCFWSISHFWTLRLSTYSHWEFTWDDDAHTNFRLF